MGRQPCCEKEAVKKGPWSAEEDRKLIFFITSHGHGCWREVPRRAGLQRCGKSCRLRWINYLRPDLKRGMLSADEESLIIHLHACHGNKWSKIASHLPGRTDNEIKNCWNTRIKKKLREMGIDPATHKTISKAPPTVTDSSETRGPALQRTGVNVPPYLGHAPFDPLNAAAYLYNMQIPNTTLQEAILGASPTSVMSTHVTSSLSHTSPTTKCEDEHSNYSADSVSQDHSINSSMQKNMHALATQEGLTSDSHPIFTSTPIGKGGPQNMLSGELHNHPYMPNPPQPILHNLPHGHPLLEIPIPLHMLQKETNIQNPFNSLTPLHPLHISQLQASQMAQPMRYVPALQQQQHRGSQPSFPICEKVENTGKPLSSSMKSNKEVRCEEHKEGHVDDVEGEKERVPVSKTSKYVKEGAGLAPLVQCELKCEEAEGGNNGGANVKGGQYWSSMMSETFFADTPVEGAPEPQVMSPLLYETSQALGQQSMGMACNAFMNVGPWGNMDGLLSSDPKYSFY